MPLAFAELKLYRHPRAVAQLFTAPELAVLA